LSKTIVIIGTLDTKGEELKYVKDLIEHKGYQVIVVDGGILGQPLFKPDISREQVAQAADSTLAKVIALRGEGKAIAVMERGVGKIALELYSTGRLDGIVALGGTMGTWLGLGAMRPLPLYVPKLMVSTVAFTHFITAEMVAKGQMMAECVAGLWGLNVITKAMLDTAVGSLLGMVETAKKITLEKPIVGITTLGSAAFSYVYKIKPRLEERGYEVAVFHTSGIGGLTMERLIEEGLIKAVLDLCLIDLGAHIINSTFSVGPNRLEAAVKKGIPVIAAPGGTDFGCWTAPPEKLPPRFRKRTLHMHNPNDTVFVLTKKEKAAIGKLMAQKLNRATGPAAVVLPLRSFSAFDVPGGIFYDPEGRKFLIESFKKYIKPKVKTVEVDANINDQEFVEAVMVLFDEMMR
jgi:uncharacterized protein (UPF0261 family)